MFTVSYEDGAYVGQWATKNGPRFVVASALSVVQYAGERMGFRVSVSDQAKAMASRHAKPARR